MEVYLQCVVDGQGQQLNEVTNALDGSEKIRCFQQDGQIPSEREILQARANVKTTELI